jgi:hypothetical protein
VFGADPDRFLADSSGVTGAIWVARRPAEAGRASLSRSGRDLRSEPEVGMAALGEGERVANHRGSLERENLIPRDFGHSVDC